MAARRPRGRRRRRRAGRAGWIELACGDVEAAKAFYGAVLGWSGETHQFGDTSSYTEFTPPGGTRPVAGMVRMNEDPDGAVFTVMARAG